MKLFTKEINDKLFKQYPLGSDLSKQKVIAKIFNPYGNGRWFLINSDENDPDYLWAIVEMGGNVEMGSVSRSELEGIKLTPFRLGLERDLGFRPINAEELFKGLSEGKFYKRGGYMAGGGEVKWQDVNIGDNARVKSENKMGVIFSTYGRKFNLRFVDGSEKTYDASDLEFFKDEEYAHGGDVEQGNLDMVKNQVIQVEHHAKELMETLKSNPQVDAWVVAKMDRATSNLSDITHYLEGEKKSFSDGGQKEEKFTFFGTTENGWSVKDNESNKWVKPIGRMVWETKEDAINDIKENKFKYAEGGMMAKGGATSKIKKADKLRKEGAKVTLSFEGSKSKLATIKQHIENMWYYDEENFSDYGNEIYFYNVEFRDAESLRDWAKNKFSDVEISISYKGNEYESGGEMAKGGIIPNEINNLYEFLRSQFKNTKFSINPVKGLTDTYRIRVWDDGFFSYKGRSGNNYAIELGKKFKKLNIKTELKLYNPQGHETDTIVVYQKNKMAEGGMMAKGGLTDKEISLIQSRTAKEVNQYVPKTKNLGVYFDKGGKTTFKDKVKSITTKLLKKKKVSPKVQKDYGKTFNKKEAIDSAKRIAGAMRKKEKMSKGGSLTSLKKQLLSRIKSSHSKKMTDVNLDEKTKMALRDLWLDGILIKKSVKGTQDTEYTLKKKD